MHTFNYSPLFDLLLLFAEEVLHVLNSTFIGEKENRGVLVHRQLTYLQNVQLQYGALLLKQMIYALSISKWKYGTTKFSFSVFQCPSTLHCRLKSVVCPSHKRWQRILGLCCKTEGKLGYHVTKSTSPVALAAQDETITKHSYKKLYLLYIKNSTEISSVF